MCIRDRSLSVFELYNSFREGFLCVCGQDFSDDDNDSNDDLNSSKYNNDNSNNNMTCIVPNQFLVTSLYFPLSPCKFRELGEGGGMVYLFKLKCVVLCFLLFSLYFLFLLFIYLRIW